MLRSLESLKLRPELVAACRKQGFVDATPIQTLVIPSVLKGRDVLVEAKTGSGKTLAYGLPLLQAEPGQSQFPEVLVLTPTRELTNQIADVLKRTAGKLERRVVALPGGSGMDAQAKALREGAHIVVGTLGRIEELRARGLLRLDHLRTLVLDEVDELMQGGFSAELSDLLKHLKSRKQTLLFSATIPREVEAVAGNFMHDPVRLQLNAAREMPVELSHRILRTSVKTRVKDLAAFLRAEKPYQLLLFCGTRHEAEEVHEGLASHGFEAEFFHGELSPTRRRKIMESFRDGDLPILIATDLAARGLDLPGVGLVMNYSFPETPALYTHRAGRTGRAGKPGVVVTLLIEQQHSRFENLRKTFPFKKVELHGDRNVVRELKTREEHDLEFRRLPRHAPEDAESDDSGSADEREPAPLKRHAPTQKPRGGPPKRGKR